MDKSQAVATEETEALVAPEVSLRALLQPRDVGKVLLTGHGRARRKAQAVAMEETAVPRAPHMC